MDLILVYFVATLSLVFTNQVSDTDWQHGIVHNSFEFGDEHSLKTERTKPSTIVSSPHKERRSVNSDSSNLKLAAFNIQTFGTKKMATAGVPDILVKVGMLLQCCSLRFRYYGQIHHTTRPVARATVTACMFTSLAD